MEDNKRTLSEAKRKRSKEMEGGRGILKKIRRLFQAIQQSAYKTSKGEQDFPGSPVGKTLYFHCRGRGSIPGQGTRSHMCMVQPEKVGVEGQAVGAEQSKVRRLSKKQHRKFSWNLRTQVLVQ